MTQLPSSDYRFQRAVELAGRIASEERAEADAAWDFAWKRRLFPQWTPLLRLLPSILVTEFAAIGLQLAQRWLSLLVIDGPAAEEDLGDQGLALALLSLSELSEIPIWHEAAHELERAIITIWIGRICEASTQQHEFRLKRLYALTREIGTLHVSTTFFAAQSLQTRSAESIRKGVDLRQDLEGALESLFDTVSDEVLLALLCQEHHDGLHMSLEHAFFLRGVYAPTHALLEVACNSQRSGESRGCAIRSLRLLGLSRVAFPVESLIDALEDASVRAPLLWALSTQGAAVPAEVFQRYVDEPDEFTHRSAMAGLTAPERPESREMLLNALQDANKFVRMDAIWALCRLGKDAPMEAITAMLHDQDTFVQQKVVFALNLLRKQAPISLLIAASEEKDLFVRQTAVGILGSLDEQIPVDHMLKLLRRQDAPFTTISPNSIRLVAIQALGRAGSSAAVPVLQQVLEDPDPSMVLAAVEALLQLGVQPSFEPLLTHRALTIPRFRSPLVRAISRLGEQAMRATLLQSEQPPLWVQIAAVEVLAECDTADAAESLRLALREKHVLVKIAAMAAMSKHPELRPDIPLDRFFQYLYSQNMRLQGSARHALWTIGPRVDLPVETVSSFLEQPVGLPLTEVLGNNCQKIPVERVRELLTSKQPGMRARAIEILGMAGDQTPVDLLTQMLQDTDSDVRFTTAQVLGTLGERIPVEALMHLLKDEDHAVRKAAIEALAKAGERAPLDALIHALDDEECEVDIAATRALLELQAYQPLWRLLDVALQAEEPEQRIDAMIKLIEASVIERLAADIPVEPCVQALTHEHEDVRQYAAEILGILARQGRAIPSEPLLALLDDMDDMTCGAALSVLSELTPRVSSEIFLRFLDSERNYPCMCAISALGHRGEEAPLGRLLDFLTLSGSANQGLRSAAVEALTTLGDLAPRDALVRALHDEEAHIRWQASEALKQLGSRIPLELLEPEVYSSDEMVRRHVLSILKECRPDVFGQLAQSAREKLLTGAEGETSPQHLALFAEAAGFLEQPSSALIETLVELLHHPDQEARIQAALALGRLQQPLPDAAWDRLFTMRASSEISAVRHAAASALHELLSLERGPSEEFLAKRTLQ